DVPRRAGGGADRAGRRQRHLLPEAGLRLRLLPRPPTGSPGQGGGLPDRGRGGRAGPVAAGARRADRRGTDHDHHHRARGSRRMSTRKLALIGTGMMGKLHARVIGQSMQAELVRVVDPNEEAARPVVEQHGAEWTPEIGSLTGVDGVIVASATETHHKLALEVIDLGKPVLVEKPLCGSLAETKEVLATAERQGVPLMCGLLERYNPAVLTAKALLEEPIHVIAQRHSPYAPRIKTGVAWDLLVHDVDLAIQMFGGATPVHTIAEAGYFHPGSVEG